MLTTAKGRRFGGAGRGTPGRGPYNRSITGFISLLVWSVGACVIAITIWRRRGSLVSKRGMGVRADLELLNDAPRVRVSEVTMTGPEMARIGLVAAQGSEADQAGQPAEPVNNGALDPGIVGLEFSIVLNETDPGYPLLHEWMDRQCVLGVVIPPDSPLIRLRCLEDLQPLTLRRVDAPA